MKASWVHALDHTYRVRQPGETVTTGDYLQIGDAYSLVDGSIWVGDVIEHGGRFETVWTQDTQRRSAG
jgi:nitric oxide reductase large subunit